MGMPQIEAYENHIIAMKEGNGASHSCYKGVADLIHFMAGRVKELWNVVRYWRLDAAERIVARIKLYG